LNQKLLEKPYNIVYKGNLKVNFRTTKSTKRSLISFATWGMSLRIWSLKELKGQRGNV
jgi:hypothetical protein